MAKSNKLKMERSFLIFPENQKKKIVQEIESGLLTRQQAREKYNIVDNGTLRSWILLYSTNPKTILKPKSTPEDRRRAVYQILQGEATVEQIAMQMKVSLPVVSAWVRDIRSKEIVVITEDGRQERDKQIEAFQLKVAALETMIDIAERELKIDIRKKSGTKQ
jgi:transposase-like protein